MLSSGINQSVEGLELAQLPVLVGAVRQVAPNYEGDALLGQFLLCDGQWVPVHVGDVVGVEVEWGVFGDLDCADSDDFGLFELGHEGGGDPVGVGLVGRVAFLQHFIVVLRFLAFLLRLLFLLFLVGGAAVCSLGLVALVVLRAF